VLHIPPPEQLGLKAQDGAVLHDLPPLVGSSVACTAQRSSDPGHSSRDGDPTLAKVRESGCWALSVVREDELAAAPAVLDIILVPGEIFRAEVTARQPRETWWKSSAGQLAGSSGSPGETGRFKS
jgi:hypothetical protein